MITITYAHARSLAGNRNLLMKLYSTQMPVKTAKRMKRILERVGLAAKHVDEAQYTLQMQAAKVHAELDEKGDPKMDEKGELIFKSDEDRAEANKFMVANLGPVLKRELTLLVDPINIEDTKLELTLAEIDILSPILTPDLDDAEPEASEQEPA